MAHAIRYPPLANDHWLSQTTDHRLSPLRTAQADRGVRGVRQDEGSENCCFTTDLSPQEAFHSTCVSGNPRSKRVPEDRLTKNASIAPKEHRGQVCQSASAQLARAAGKRAPKARLQPNLKTQEETPPQQSTPNHNRQRTGGQHEETPRHLTTQPSLALTAPDVEPPLHRLFG
jgi:hypothetical protein